MNPRDIAGTVIKLFIASVLVGLFLSIFKIDPVETFGRLGTAAERIFNLGVGAVQWAVPFALAGAVIVLPIWLISRILRSRKR